MPMFAVAKPGVMTEREFEDYEGLLGKHGIDVNDAWRVHEPEAQDRWLCAWGHRDDAERFADALRNLTGERSWKVQPLREEDCVTKGPIGPVTIYVNPQSEGCTFQLRLNGRNRIRKKFPLVEPWKKPIFIGYQAWDDFERNDWSVLLQVTRLLTGLSEDQVDQLGGVRFYDPSAERTLWERLGPMASPV
jgi:hypothetical protein